MNIMYKPKSETANNIIVALNYYNDLHALKIKNLVQLEIRLD